MTQPLQIAFLGSDPIALPLLEWLAGEGRAAGSVAVVYTQPDRPAGRGQKVVANAIKSWALAHGVPVRQPEKLTGEQPAEVAALGVDLALVMAYGHLLRDELIAAPRLGTVNLHASILPQYRGASPIQTAIACGERETGVALMRMVRKLDAGPVADLERVAIGPRDTAVDVEARLAAACVPLLARTLPRLADGELMFRAQDEAAASYCRKLEKDDGALDFTAPAAVLAARINGLFPWPACAAEIAGATIKFGLADRLGGGGCHIMYDNGSRPGRVLGMDEAGLRVGTGAGVLRVRRMQRPGGRMMDAAEFLRGFPLPAGTEIASRPMTPLVAPQPFKKK
ncbi:MAG TPA: methionyl-tRNA formyltransferase [Opitutus sp.]|nr:methionyl-tRNA formyltransferase [Opitutus sp.]